jgi:hypothetical protein
MNIKDFLFETIAPAVIVSGLAYAVVWSLIDFVQGGY